MEKASVSKSVRSIMRNKKKIQLTKERSNDFLFQKTFLCRAIDLFFPLFSLIYIKRYKFHFFSFSFLFLYIYLCFSPPPPNSCHMYTDLGNISCCGNLGVLTWENATCQYQIYTNIIYTRFYIYTGDRIDRDEEGGCLNFPFLCLFT